MNPHTQVTEQLVKTARHSSFYLGAGRADAPLIIFVHGWPELAISWRHQLRCFAALGFRVVAPDMRGYGRSTVHPQQADYAMEQLVADMRELLAGLGAPSALWVGHDWGAQVVWSLAQQHPALVQGLASLCVPYLPGGFCPDEVIPLVDRAVYPADAYPAGQWDYQLFYEEQFERACAVFDADPRKLIQALFRKGSPAGRGKPAGTASVRRHGGWFGGADSAPDLPLDTDLLSAEDLQRYATALARNGSFGPNAWYMNAKANASYARRAPPGQRLAMPVLFFHGAFDYVCDTTGSRLAEPMRAACTDLTELTLPTGHWMAQERPDLVNARLARWLATRLPQHWPV